MNQKDKLIVLSGGMDSVTMLYDFKEQIALAVSFHYGSNHNDQELHFAKMHCQQLGIRHEVINLDFFRHHFKSSLLEGADAIPEGAYDEENMKSTVVPFRNGIMLSIAAGMANSAGLRYVMIANHSGDHSIYPDCRPEFIHDMNSAIASGTDQEVHVMAPYTQLTKTQIAQRGAQLGLDYSQTWSCYKGGEHHCGVCGTCVERREALRDAGINDTTIYDD